MELFCDVETSGFISNKIPANHPDQAWIVQIAAILSTREKVYNEFSFMLLSMNRKIHPAAEAVHHISVEDADNGVSETTVASLFLKMLDYHPTVVCHNYPFDSKFIMQLLDRNGYNGSWIKEAPAFCTMRASTDICKLPFKSNKNWGVQKYKWPKLEELYFHLFQKYIVGAHDALADTKATRECYYELLSREQMAEINSDFTDYINVTEEGTI